MPERKLILYISASLDGFIATHDDDLSWLSVVEREGEDYGYAAFNATVDTYIVGRRTYDKVRELTGGSFPAAEQHRCYVITRRERPDENGVSFYNGDIEALIRGIRQKPGKHIYCDGGSQVVKLLMDRDLIDTYIISVVPILLGAGKRLFAGDTPRFALRALPAKQFESGLVQLRYERVRG